MTPPINLGILAAAAGGVFYRLQTIGDNIDSLEASDVAVDSQGNVIIVGPSAAGPVLLLVKCDPDGNILWQKELGSNVAGAEQYIAIDSNDNIVVGSANDPFPFETVIVKYNSSGTIQWQRTLSKSNERTFFAKPSIDSNDDIIITAEASFGSTSTSDKRLLTAKITSSGTLVWQRKLGSARTDQASNALDSFNNAYVAAQDFTGTFGESDALLAKYNSSGTIQWQRITGGSTTDRFSSVATDSNDDVYFAGGTGLFDTPSFPFLAKYNSSGTLQWQRLLNTVTDRNEYISVAVDSLDNVYGLVSFDTGNDNEFAIVKYNSSGTIQWQRELNQSDMSHPESIFIDYNNNIYVVAYTRGGLSQRHLFLAVLPSDGSLTGSYDLNNATYTYQASTYNSSAGSVSEQSSSLNEAAADKIMNTSSLSELTPAYVSEITYIG